MDDRRCPCGKGDLRWLSPLVAFCETTQTHKWVRLGGSLHHVMDVAVMDLANHIIRLEKLVAKQDEELAVLRPVARQDIERSIAELREKLPSRAA